MNAKNVVVVGLGNVAVDVTRILMKNSNELQETDMPEHVLDALAQSGVEQLHVVGRRGPQHATFTTKELKELGELAGVGVTVMESDLPLDDSLASDGNRVIERNLAVMRSWVTDQPEQTPKGIHFHFFRTPKAFEADSHKFLAEEMQLHEDGTITGTGRIEEIPADLVIRSVGYRGTELEGLPFDAVRNVIPSADGKVESLANSYVAGWIKRGPSGIIGTNKKDAVATVSTIMNDLKDAKSRAITAAQVDQQRVDRGISFGDAVGWRRIDSEERSRGERRGRERITIHDRDELIAVATGLRDQSI